MSELTEEQKEVIRELRKALNGKCGVLCPSKIAVRKKLRKNGKFVFTWDCIHCDEHFLWLDTRDAFEKKTEFYCPCRCIPYETIDLRFSELLDEEL